MSTPTPRPPGLGGSPAASIRSLAQHLDDWHTPLGTVVPASRPTSSRSGSRGGAGATQPPGAAAHTPQLGGLLAAKESEAALLRQQLQQLTGDFKFNLKLLEERDAELERLEAVVGGLREAAASHQSGLAEARRQLSDRDAALREKEARVAALEERQKQLVELCERQVADARASRDEEVARCRQEATAIASDAARTKANAIADYERQVSAAAAAEREARAHAREAGEEAEHVRSALQRAEARLAEQELAMGRMVAQFEGALGALQQLEAQYEGLAADAGAADRMRAGRIAELEAEVEGLRAARAELQAERNASVGALEAALAGAERAAGEAKQAFHRAMMDAAELTEALAEARTEAHAARSRAAAAEEELAAVRSASQQAQQALEREAAAHARSQGLLEASRLHQETARRDAHEQEALAAQLREAAAVLEAERNDLAQALEAALTKLQAAEERATLAEEHQEHEGQLRAGAVEAREAELAMRWERALEAAQSERATLQQALDLANRQLAGAHRDMEALRAQVQQLRLGAPPPLQPPASPGYAGSSGSSRRQAAAAVGPAAATAAAGSVGGESVQETTSSPSASRDVFSELQPPDHQLRQQQHGGSGGGAASSTYQQQLHQHIDTLAGKLSTFQRAVEEARHVGHQASQQLAESRSMLPVELQRRQVAVADAKAQAALAAERQQFEAERRRLDRQLAEQQRLLAEREAALQRLQHAEDEQRRRRQEEEEVAQRRQRLREQLELEEQRRRQEAAAAAAAATPAAAAASPTAGFQSLLDGSCASPAASYGQRRSVGAALAAAGGLPPLSSGGSPALYPLQPAAAAPTASYASSYRRAAPVPQGAPLQPPGANGRLAPVAAGAGAGSSRTAPLRAAAGGLGAPPAPGAAAPRPPLVAAAGAAEDPLARARRQVLAAKDYLRQVAEMGGRGGGGSGA